MGLWSYCRIKCITEAILFAVITALTAKQGIKVNVIGRLSAEYINYLTS